MTSEALILAVPSKGRLKEQFDHFLAKADMPITSTGRGYSGRVQGIEGLEVRFLSASEIVHEIQLGKAHLGITGRDLVDELAAGSPGKPSPERVAPLRFGHARMVVAIPDAWVDVVTMADLRDVAALMYREQGRQIRVATKYVNLTRQFFARHGISDYRLVESLGATEGAPRAGSADLVVDITSTGSTLVANQLRILSDGEILNSQAYVYASTSLAFSHVQRVVLRHFLDRLEARIEAEQLREIRAALPIGVELSAEANRRFGFTLPWHAHRLEDGGTLVTLHGQVDQIAGLVEYLKGLGAGTITVYPLVDLYKPDRRLYADLAPKLGFRE